MMYIVYLIILIIYRICVIISLFTAYLRISKPVSDFNGKIHKITLQCYEVCLKVL